MRVCRTTVCVLAACALALTVLGGGALAESLLGDTNHDGVVDDWDITVVVSCYNVPGVGLAGDFDSNGIINGYDLNVVLSNYGSGYYMNVGLSNLETTASDLGGGANTQAAGVSASAAVVPEPGMVALLASGLLGWLAYAWRKRR
jgi:hypothetical protein